MLNNFFGRLKGLMGRTIRGFLTKISPSYKLLTELNNKITGIENKQMAMFWYNQNLPGEPLSETKKRFFRNMPKAEGTVRQVQEIVNEILIEMDSVCRKNGIRYWIMGGTLIGAIRHEGFIPWDDDGDVGMMRCDYEKFKEAVADNPIIELQEFYNFNGGYRIPKIIIRGTREKLAVDIIVFDFANRGKTSLSAMWKAQQKIRKAYVAAMKRYRIHMLDFARTDIIRNPKKAAAVHKITEKYVAKCHYLPDDGDTVIWGVDNFTSKAPDPQRIYRTEAIFPLGELMFEGHSYYVVSDYMDMITREAGDIWSLPNDVGKPKFFTDAQMKAMVEACNIVRDRRNAQKEEKA